MFVITSAAGVVAYGSRLQTRELVRQTADNTCVADLYGFPRLVLSQEACLEHVGGRGLLDIFKGTRLQGVEGIHGAAEPIGISGILLGDFDMLRTGRPDLLRAVLVSAGNRGPAPKLRTLVETALDMQRSLPA